MGGIFYENFCVDKYYGLWLKNVTKTMQNERENEWGLPEHNAWLMYLLPGSADTVLFF